MIVYRLLKWYMSLLDLCAALLTLLPALTHIPHYSTIELCSVSDIP